MRGIVGGGAWEAWEAAGRREGGAPSASSGVRCLEPCPTQRRAPRALGGGAGAASRLLFAKPASRGTLLRVWAVHAWTVPSPNASNGITQSPKHLLQSLSAPLPPGRPQTPEPKNSDVPLRRPRVPVRVPQPSRPKAPAAARAQALPGAAARGAGRLRLGPRPPPRPRGGARLVLDAGWVLPAGVRGGAAAGAYARVWVGGLAARFRK
jgi:hypothetical protein